MSTSYELSTKNNCKKFVNYSLLNTKSFPAENKAKLKTPLVEFIEQRRAELLQKVDRKPQYDFMSSRQLERIRLKEERKKQRSERKRLRDAERYLRRKGLHKKNDTLEEELQEEEDDDEEDLDEVSARDVYRSNTFLNSIIYIPYMYLSPRVCG